MKKNIPEPVPINLSKIDKLNFIAYYNNETLAIKRKIEAYCNICNKIYITKITDERKREFKWHCTSCKTKAAWKKTDYRKKHLINNVRLSNNPRHQAIRSEIVRKQWRNPKHREHILSKLHNLEVWKKCIKPHWKEYNNKKFRSSYEVKVAQYLDSKNIKWEYEPKMFFLTKLNKRYIPDFYLKDFDLWIEIKGYCTEETLLKYNLFREEYKYKIILITGNEINNLEKINEIN